MKKSAIKTKSTRNRHTGRINDYKARIIKQGKKLVDSKGVTYYSIQSGSRSSGIGFMKKVVPVFSVVRMF